MLYSNDSDDAIRACEEARTGFYGYDEGDSSVDESLDKSYGFPLEGLTAIREADEKKHQEYWYKIWGVK